VLQLFPTGNAAVGVPIALKEFRSSAVKTDYGKNLHLKAHLMQLVYLPRYVS